MIFLHNPWSEWDLTQWLNHLENRNIKEIQLGLTRIMAVARKLKVHIPSCTVINVAGTNGKGSTVTALETIYRTAGYNVGTYTSPHLIHFNERICVNSTPISDADLCRAFCLIEKNRGDIVLTYFEMTTLAALIYFTKHTLDLIILETGLGGRLDATNIVDADLSIITTIDFDHQEYLGTTLEAIGYEKAGILRKGKPFIYADINPPDSIVAQANKLDALSYFYGREYTFKEHDTHWEMKYLSHHLDQLPKPLIQLKSAAAAIMASFMLNNKLPVLPQQINDSMNSIFIAGRLELYRGDISILYDVSHNPQSAGLLATTLHQMNIKGRVHAVFSALKDKDIAGLITPLKACIDAWYPAELDAKRGVDAHFMIKKFEDAEISVKICYTSPLIAFETALSQARTGDLIVVYGSFLTVGQVLNANANHRTLTRRRLNENSNG